MGSLIPNTSSLRSPNGFLSSRHSNMGPGKGDPESPCLWRDGISVSVFHRFLFGHIERRFGDKSAWRALCRAPWAPQLVRPLPHSRVVGSGEFSADFLPENPSTFETTPGGTYGLHLGAGPPRAPFETRLD